MIKDKIYFGDCMDILPTIPDKSVDMTLTDIPYGEECNKESGGLRNIDKGLASICEIDLVKFVEHLKRVTKGSIYCFCGIEQISQLFTLFSLDMSVRLCHWHKTNPAPMNGQYLWLSATENCIYAKHPSATFNQFCKPNVWRFKSGNSEGHNTRKPVDLFKFLIESSSNKEDIIFDPCIGGGTTAIAAVASDRHFIGIEKNKKWFEFANKEVKFAIQSDMFCLQNHYGEKLELHRT